VGPAEQGRHASREPGHARQRLARPKRSRLITSRRRRNELANVTKPSHVRAGKHFSLKSGRPPLTAEGAAGWLVDRLRRNAFIRPFLPR
jgi:hypothetical protein